MEHFLQLDLRVGYDESSVRSKNDTAVEICGKTVVENRDVKSNF
jgi:hypothetical protein